MRFQSGNLNLSIDDLPAIPGLVADALRILEDPGASSVDIEAVIQRDQALAARVLRVVNSAAYGFSRRVETIREAVVLLGTRTLRGLASASLSAQFFAGPIEGLADPRRLWAHSLAASVWAMEIIDFKRAWHAQSAVMAALLHDIGIVILCQFAPDRYRAILEMSKTEHCHHLIIEQRELGTNHARVGATLCAKWLLPVSLTQLINAHHVDHAPADDALSVVVLGDHLAHAHGHASFEWLDVPPLPDGLLRNLAITDEDTQRLNQRAERVDERVATLLDTMTATAHAAE